MSATSLPSPKKILIVKLSSIGDVVHTLPVLRTLRKWFPQAFIAWMVEGKMKDILYKNQDLDEIIVVRTKAWRRDWSGSTLQEIKETLQILRNHRFDTVFDFQGLIKTGVLSALTRAPNRIGFHWRDCREWPNIFFSNHPGSYFGTHAHVVEKNLSLLKFLGIDRFVHEFPLTIPSEAEVYIEKFFDRNPELKNDLLIAVNPGVGFRTKEWALQRFSKLADRISAELGGRILLTWGPGEKEKIEAIGKQMTRPYWVAPKTDIHQSLALYRRLRLIIGCDTGPLHLCSALKVPTLSIFGPTDPVRNGPYGQEHSAVYKKLSCSFCYKRSCPTQNECMEEIGVEEVFEAVKKNLYNCPQQKVSHLKID